MYTRLKLKTKNLRLLSYTKKLFSDIDLNNVFIFAVQHLFLSTYQMFKGLVDLGLKPENIALIGKCYSSDPEAIQALKNLNINISETSFEFNSHIPYNLQFKSKIKKFFIDICYQKKLDKYKKIILLDDGGNLLADIIPELKFYYPNIVGIEQTTSGYNLLKNSEIKFPIINVARSHIKLIYESPLIAQTVARRLYENLLELDLNYDKSNVLILGNGFIGKAIKKEIKQNFRKIYSYDIRKKCTDIKRKNFKNNLKYFDVIIGCTGFTSISKNDFRFLKKGVILISASSSDIEFDSVYIRNRLPLSKSFSENYYFKGLHLINSGFPVNFSTDFEKSDPVEFELTRSILFAAICQAINSSNLLPKFINLDRNIQKKIIQKYLELYDKI